MSVIEADWLQMSYASSRRPRVTTRLAPTVRAPSMRLSESLTGPRGSATGRRDPSHSGARHDLAGARRRTTEDRYCHMIRKVMAPGRVERGPVWQERCPKSACRPSSCRTSALHRRRESSAGLRQGVDGRAERRPADRRADRGRLLAGVDRPRLWGAGPATAARRGAEAAAAGGHPGGVAAGPVGSITTASDRCRHRPGRPWRGVPVAARVDRHHCPGRSAGVPPVRGAGPVLCYLDTPRRLPPPLGAGRLIQWAPAERSRDARHQGQGRRHRSAGAADDGGEPVVPVVRYLGHLIDAGYSPHTACAYGYDLRYLFEFLGAEGVSWQAFGPSTALIFLGHLRRRPTRRPAQRLGLAVATGEGRLLAPATVQRVLAATSSFYEWAIAAGEYAEPENPLRREIDPALARVPERHQPFVGTASRQRPVRRAVRVRLPMRLPRPLEGEEVQAVLDSMATLRDLAMTLLMLDGGLRPGEVLGLHLDDVA